MNDPENPPVTLETIRQRAERLRQDFEAGLISEQEAKARAELLRASYDLDTKPAVYTNRAARRARARAERNRA